MGSSERRVHEEFKEKVNRATSVGNPSPRVTEGSSESKVYAEFKEKVNRTVYVDNLSPQVTETVLRTAFDQFGTVRSINFIPNFIGPANIPLCALVEMDNDKQAGYVITTTAEFPFMISGMPRPIRTRLSQPEMFDLRPHCPSAPSLEFRWLDPSHPGFSAAKTLQILSSRHSAEAAFMLKRQQAEEALLAAKQLETLNGSYKKHEKIESVNKTAQRLDSLYKKGNNANHF